MEPHKQPFAIITALVALALAVMALVELHAPNQLLTTVPNRLESRISQLEQTIVLQREAVDKLEGKSDSDTKNKVNNLRDGMQSALNQVANQLGEMHAQIAKLEQAAKTTPVIAPELRTRITNFVYTSAPGDTLESIAAKFGTSTTVIDAANPQDIDFDNLRAGQKVIVPLKSAY